MSDQPPSGFQLAISDFEATCLTMLNGPEHPVRCTWPSRIGRWCERHERIDPRAPDLNAPQPLPTHGTAVPTWLLVMADMRARDAIGGAKYGTRHQHDNGRDHLVDVYQELLDAACYIRAEIERRRQLRKSIAAGDLEP